MRRSDGLGLCWVFTLLFNVIEIASIYYLYSWRYPCNHWNRNHGNGETLASVRRPRTLISIWTFVSCVRGLLSPASLNMRARATLRGVVLLLVDIYVKPTNNKFIPTREVFSIKNYISGHSWHLCFIDFSSQVCIRGWRWILRLSSNELQFTSYTTYLTENPAWLSRYNIHLAILIYQLMLVRFYMQLYGVTALPLGGSLLRACSKKQGSEALAHN